MYSISLYFDYNLLLFAHLKSSTNSTNLVFLLAFWKVLVLKVNALAGSTSNDVDVVGSYQPW